MIKKINKYSYIDVPRSENQGTRTYDVNGIRLPSVTTILSRTKDQRFLKEWKARVGEKKAEEIKNLSSKRGTSMHKYLEHYVIGKGYEDLNNQTDQRRENGLTTISCSLQHMPWRMIIFTAVVLDKL